jgi:hypothetical protein
MTEEKLIPVYLFGPIGNGRINEPVMQVIKKGIEKDGGEVLTPHVASWKEAIRLRKEWGWTKLWDFDKGQMHKARVAFGEVSFPSIGVGREIERLRNIERVPVVSFRATDSDYQTASLDGDSDPGLILVSYWGLDELSHLMSDYMERVKKVLLTAAPGDFLTPLQLSKIRG